MMAALRRSWVRLWLLPVLLCFGFGPASADTAIGLRASFDGRVNFTGTQVTWRAHPNGNANSNNGKACTVYTPSSTRYASLQIPAGATVLSAQLYWAGSGSGDYTVLFQGYSVGAARRYASSTVGGGLNYFSGAADVTSVVRDKGSGTYSFSGLTVANGSPWCASQAVMGGFSLLVVYSHPSQPERVLNIYEGFRYVQNSTVTVTASNFRWPSPAYPVKERARVGHITWEGDPTLSGGGERLLFEGNELTDSMNPEGNQFNSRSNINSDNYSYGIDFDAYDTTVTMGPGYDARVSTTYRTGQDLVLLSAEVLLVPTLPVSDLSVNLTGPAELQVGQLASYGVVVRNNGPYTEAGPITVTDTLPAGMSFVTSTGNGWKCAASGQVVTCTYSGALAPGSSAPELTLTASVQSVGEKTNKVKVSGTDDDDLANNTASHTATAKAAAPPPVTSSGFAFTRGACTPRVIIGGKGSGCSSFTGPRIAGDTQEIHVTAVDKDGVPVALSDSVGTKVPMRFSLSCVDPAADAGVKAFYAGVELPLCTGGGKLPAATSGWSSEVQVSFPAGKASVPASFGYADVGTIHLNLLQGTNTARARFVSRPWKLAFRSIHRVRGGVRNPGTSTPTGAAFAQAGEDLQAEVIALLYNTEDTTKWAPNFGNEAVPAPVALTIEPMHTDSKEAYYQPSAGELITVADPEWSGGVRTFNVAWSEVGATRFVARLTGSGATGEPVFDRYLGVGGVTGTQQNVGRFYPAYFTTDITAPFACPLGQACASDTSGTVGAAYSGQPFAGVVNVLNAQDGKVSNFSGAWYKAVTLTAVSAPEGAELARQFTSAPWAAPAAGGSISGQLSYALERPYLTASPRANNWSAPTGVFLRASSDDTELVPNGTAQVLVRSLRAPEPTSEGGIMVLNGRLRVGNALGTDLLRTPLTLQAQYWSEGAWRNHAAYADPAAGVSAARVAFSDCTRGLATAAARPNNCNAAVAADAQTITLANGSGVLWLRAPGKLPSGRSRDGSVSVQFAPDYQTWLPSTVGRVTFGTHRSPLIYVRELY